MNVAYRMAGTALVIAGMWVVASGSTAPLTVHRSEQGIVRLAWSVRPERVEECREQTAEELAKLPQHMRQKVVCEGSSARYRLTVRDGDSVVTERIVRGGGLRHDRRIYVFEEMRVGPGEASIKVRFDRIDGEDRDSRESKHDDAVPPHLAFEEHLRIRPREVILITYSSERRALVAKHAE